MQEPERKPEARAVPQGERMEPEMGATVTPMMRGAYAPAWYSRLSWGAIFGGVFIAIATQLVLTAFVTWIGLVATTITDVAALQDVFTSIGIWTAVSAVISLFIGAWAASRLGAVQFTSDGLWHGAVVWALSLVVGIFLSTSGITGLLGFGANAVTLFRGIIPTDVTIPPQDVQTIAGITASAAGWFLLGSLVALGAALLGGWLGSRRMSRAQAMEQAGRERMAA